MKRKRRAHGGRVRLAGRLRTAKPTPSVWPPRQTITDRPITDLLVLQSELPATALLLGAVTAGLLIDLVTLLNVVTSVVP